MYRLQETEKRIQEHKKDKLMEKILSYFLTVILISSLIYFLFETLEEPVPKFHEEPLSDLDLDYMGIGYSIES